MDGLTSCCALRERLVNEVFKHLLTLGKEVFYDAFLGDEDFGRVEQYEAFDDDIESNDSRLAKFCKATTFPIVYR